MPSDLFSPWEQLNAEHLAGIVHIQTAPGSKSGRKMELVRDSPSCAFRGNKLFIIQAPPNSQLFQAHPC